MEAALQLFGKKDQKSKGLVGLWEQENGVGIALVVLEEAGTPRLACCDFAFSEKGRGRNRSVQELISRHDLDSFPCVGGMALGSYDLLQVETPDVAENEKAEAVRWQIGELIDYPIDQAIIDLFEVPSRGQEAIAFVVASRREEVQKRVDFLHDSKLEVEAIDIPELMMRNVAALLPEAQKGVAILFFGPEQGVIMVVREGQIYATRSIQIGLDQLYDLSDAHLPGEDGQGAALTDLLDTIGLEVQRTLDFYERSSALTPIFNLLVVQMERSIPQLISHLDELLGADVRFLQLNEVIAGGESLTEEMQARCSLAIGAALRGVERLE